MESFGIVERIQRKRRELLHLRTARAVLATPPIVPTDDRLLLFSMIGTRVLLPYLVAVKSLHARLGIGRVAILDDGTLTQADKALLARHCGDPVIRSIRDVSTGDCPTGGCWERLMTLLDMTADDYVVQLDSDTVTIGPIPEVAAAIAANRSFTLLGDPTADARGLLSLPDFVAAYRPPDGAIEPKETAHVQGALEDRWDLYPDAAAHRYVRGSAGFAGFARGGAASRVSLAAFSRAASTIVGADKWRQWGSEQVASNFLVANSADPVLLPYARYLNYWAEPPGKDAAFLHFVGSKRYATGEYRRRTRDAIEALRT
jgi:hypothetical protein